MPSRLGGSRRVIVGGVSEDYAKPPAELDRSQHLAALHEGWATPLNIVAAAVAEVAKAPVLDIRRIVAGEQNEVYDVTLERAPSLIVRISHRGPEAHNREAWVRGQCASRGIPAPRVHALRRLEVGASSGPLSSWRSCRTAPGA